MSEPLVSCRGLGKVFASAAEELHVLRGLDFSADSGASVAITGASGSGKSTFLSILGGLDRPSSGELRVGEWNLSELPERKLAEFRAASVGFVFQFHYLLKDFDALENVALPAYMHGESRAQAFEKARILLEDMELGSRLHHFPSQLSGGERQRAAIARALVNSPGLVLADEPTGNLDAANARNVRKVLFGLSARYGATLILATHDRELAEAADIRYELSSGELRRT
ncbi:MAG TPA: ABC transporter ATP-binding protein [Rectinemataceae bacterium]|nr:ABC transporter ATP-binding protein [Rectinemataceae bacterium]